MKRTRYILLALFIMINASYIKVSAFGGDLYDYKAVSNQEQNKNRSQSQNQEQRESETIEGWMKKGSKTYFFKDGEKQTGWCKIQKKYYYFNEKGVLQKNKIVGSKKGGYYYVDLDGIRVTDKNIQYAVEFVRKHSNSEDTKRKRLKSCFQALCQNQYRRMPLRKPSAKKIKLYASYMFKNKTGNCYRYASALAYIARVLGYDSRVSVGGVTARMNGRLSSHGWCEVKTNGKWAICDCSMQRTHTRNNLFLVEKKNYPFRIKCDATYSMYSKKGKISWK